MTRAADELAARQRYEGEVLFGIAALVAGMQRGGRLLDDFPEHGVDASWRSEACAEFRSWRTHLDAWPTEAPPAYGEVHARLLRWAAALAAVGDDYATAQRRAQPRATRPGEPDDAAGVRLVHGDAAGLASGTGGRSGVSREDPHRVRRRNRPTNATSAPR